jgi:hypothetical protein
VLVAALAFVIAAPPCAGGSPARALVSPFPSRANTTFVRAPFVGKGVECHPWLYCRRG